MTVIELIRQLTNLDPTSEVKFGIEGEIFRECKAEVDGETQWVIADIDLDDSIHLDEMEEYKGASYIKFMPDYIKF